MSIDVSVILISHNRYPQTLLTLYSLENQTFPSSRMEVVLVDDASSDQTRKLRRFNAPFHYKYIRMDKNVGRSIAKNIGIQSASGEILIFLDGEVLVNPHFVENHVKHHQRERDIVVAGTQGHHCAYTVLYPEFNAYQFNHFYRIISKKPFLLRKWKLSLKNHTSNKRKIRRYVRRKNKPVRLLLKKDVFRNRYKYLSFPLPCFPKAILQKFGERLDGYHLAWMFCITRNASFPKHLITQAGLFDEEFNGWGYEDWEMGYRLYKLGATFIEDPKIITYHQEHPFSYEDRRKEQMQNYLTFTRKHPDIEVLAFSLDLIGKKSLLEINEIVDEYYALNQDYPYDYQQFKKYFIESLSTIPELLVTDNPLPDLSQVTGLEESPKKKSLILSEIDSLRKYEKYNHLVGTMDLLIRTNTNLKPKFI